MDKGNIIISIIIVLCIAAAVTAYGLTNSNNAIFSDLANLDSGDGATGDGIQNGTTGSSSSSSNVKSGSGSSSGSGSGGGSGGGGSGGGGSGGGGGGGGGSTILTYAQAQSIASKAIAVPGAYAGTPVLNGNYYYVPIYSANHTQIDVISVNKYTGATGRG